MRLKVAMIDRIILSSLHTRFSDWFFMLGLTPSSRDRVKQCTQPPADWFFRNCIPFIAVDLVSAGEGSEAKKRPVWLNGICC